MEKVTYRKLKDTFPKEKQTVESLYGRIVPVRNISYFVTIPFIRCGITAFQVSVISMLVAILACIMMCIPSAMTRMMGVILVPVWHILDCVDGNIARYKRTESDFGSAVDAICGYYILAFLPFALGVASYNVNNTFAIFTPNICLSFGALGSISQPLMRLIHQKFAFEAKCVEERTGKYIEKGEHQYTLTGFAKIRKMVDVEMGPVGIPMFLLWLCPFFETYGLLACYYGIINIASLIVITFFYLYKCNKGGGIANA